MTSNTMTTSSEMDRRTVVRGAAWTVPAIAVAATAPAFAVSPCNTPATGTVNFSDANAGGNYSRTSSSVAFATVPMTDGSTLRVDFKSAMSAGYTRDDTDNFRFGSAAPFPNALNMLQTRTNASTSANQGQTVTIDFARPVFGLALPLSALSWPTGNNYQDAVWVSPTATSFTRGSNVTGTGISTDPFRNPATGDFPATPFNGPTTTATVTYSGGAAGISQVVLQYFDLLGGNGHIRQGMSLLNFSFTSKNVACL